MRITRPTTPAPPLAQQVSATEAQLRAELAKLQAADAKAMSPPGDHPVPTTAVLCENAERNSLELRFPGPIPKSVSQKLKDNGWRYFFKDPKWYCHGRPEWQRRFAEQLIAELGGGGEPPLSASPKPTPPPYTPVADIVIGDLSQAHADGLNVNPKLPVMLACLQGGDYLR